NSSGDRCVNRCCRLFFRYRSACAGSRILGWEAALFGAFTRWIDLIVRRRFTVLVVVAGSLLALGGYGLGLHDHLSVSGWDAPSSEAARAGRLMDQAFGPGHVSDVLLLFHAPPGKTVDDPEFAATVVAHLNSLPKRFPDRIAAINGAYWETETGLAAADIF